MVLNFKLSWGVAVFSSHSLEFPLFEGVVEKSQPPTAQAFLAPTPKVRKDLSLFTATEDCGVISGKGSSSLDACHLRHGSRCAQPSR